MTDSRRIRANDSNTGIIYTTHDGQEVEILINDFDDNMVDSSQADYHSYDHPSYIFGSETIQDSTIIKRNFFGGACAKSRSLGYQYPCHNR